MYNFTRDFDLDVYCECLHIPDETKRVLSQIINSEPVRAPQSRHGNLCVRFPSEKMARMITAESYRNEFLFMLQCEFDNSILGYLEQVYNLLVTWVNQETSRKNTVFHTIDFLILNKEYFRFVECKPVSELQRMLSDKPGKYYKDKNGRWHFPAAEESAKNIGFDYVIITDEDINPILSQNLDYLRDYYKESSSPVLESREYEIISIIDENRGISLKSLIETYKQPADDIYKLIVSGKIFTDLTKRKLSDHEKVNLYPDQDTCIAMDWININSDPFPLRQFKQFQIKEGMELIWDGKKYTILNNGTSTISLLSADNVPIDLSVELFEKYLNSEKIKISTEASLGTYESLVRSMHLSPKQEEIANARMEMIEHKLKSLPKPAIYSTIPTRTINHYFKLYKDEEKISGYGYLGLIPKLKSGNTKSRYGSEVDNEIQTFIKSQKGFLSPHRRKKTAVLRMLNEHLIAKGYRPISYKKLKHEIDRIPKYQQTYRREGAIAAYVHKPPFICFEYTTPRQGERSFQYGYIDYTEGDIELVSSRIGVNLGKPNYCFLLDGTDKRLLAKYITFNHPNYYSDSMLIRDCVRRHHRLPSTIITDKGSNFESNHFAHLMASFQITKIDRPPREPRGGSPLERIFGTTNTEVFYNLLGNTQNSKNPRQLTPEINPKNLAVWNLPALDACLERWMSLYNDTPHPSLHGQSPNQAYLEHLHLEGIREHTYINYDLPFYFLTLPYVSRDNGLRILHENGYVRVNNLSYYCDEVAFSAFINKKVSVKFDPTNSAVVYVQLGNEWVEFYSDEFHSLKNRSIKEIEIASSELRQLDKLFNQNKSITARRIGEFLDETADQEFLLYQQLQDFDNMQINHKINADFHLLDTGICSADVEITDPGYSKQADSTEVQDNSGVLPHIEILPDY